MQRSPPHIDKEIKIFYHTTLKKKLAIREDCDQKGYMILVSIVHISFVEAIKICEERFLLCDA